jgi:two-component system, OmpR family, sensor histidine kinase BaeS
MRLNLRGRLLAGHILPVMLLIPVVGLALIYLLETRVFIPALASEMIDQGLLIGRLAVDTPQVWINPPAAQLFLGSLPFQHPSAVELLSPDDTILAASRSVDRSLIGSTVKNLPEKTVDGSPSWGITPGDRPNEQILNVLITVVTQDGHIIGLLRIFREMTDIENGLSDMRLLILLVLLAGLAISGFIAILLSESVSRPLKKLAAAISNSPIEGAALPLSESGLEEVQAITHAFNRLQVKRQELEETRQRMVANVVHEIGRPLGSLRAALHALQAGAAEDPQLRSNMLKGMTERITRMGHLLEDLSLAYRGLSPKELVFMPVDLKEWLGELEPLWRQAASEKGQQWLMEIMGELPELVTDPGRLSQALGNLVDNAIKFTPSGGKVTLIVQAESGRVQFIVCDTGPGIEPDEQVHLFTPFYRSIRPGWKAPGLGLGLSIARSIVESLGGEITLVSRAGEGSKFSLSIPVR